MRKTVETSGTTVGTAPDAVADVAAAEPAATHRIAALPAAGFWRAARQWRREAEAVRREDFTDEQWAALTGEPMLSVVAL